MLYSERERTPSVASAKCDDHQARSVLLPPRLSRTLPVASRALVEAPKYQQAQTSKRLKAKMATETENKPVVAGEEEKKVEAPAVEAAAAAAPAAADKPAEAAAAAGGGDTAADKKPEEKADAAPAAGGEGGDGATSSDAAAAPAKKEKEMKPTVHKANFEKDVVYLYQFTRTPMLPSISPFCLKVETWLRLAGLKYEVSGVPALSSPILHLKKTVRVCVCAPVNQIIGRDVTVNMARNQRTPQMQFYSTPRRIAAGGTRSGRARRRRFGVRLGVLGWAGWKKRCWSTPRAHRESSAPREQTKHIQREQINDESAKKWHLPSIISSSWAGPLCSTR